MGISQLKRCIDERIGRLVERHVWREQKMVLENYFAGLGCGDRAANLPERRRLDLSVIMRLVDDRVGIMFRPIQTAKAWRYGGAVGNGIPLSKAGILIAATQLSAQSSGPVIAESLADCIGFQGRAVPRHLVIKDR
jgi:hypothetical protein